MKKTVLRLTSSMIILLGMVSYTNAYSKVYKYDFDRGGVDGSFNGVYYSLNAGKVYLTNNTCYMSRTAGSTGGRISVYLYRERIGLDYYCGGGDLGLVTSVDQYHPTQLQNMTFNADTASSKYYLCFYGQSGPTFVGNGVISQ